MACPRILTIVVVGSLLAACAGPLTDDPYALRYNWKGHEHPVVTFSGGAITFEYYTTGEKVTFPIELRTDQGFELPASDTTVQGTFVKGRETKACGHYQLYNLRLDYPGDSTAQVYEGEILEACE